MNETITIPRLPDESARAYAARVEYITAGPQRSLEKLRGQSGDKAGIPRRFNTIAEWSSRFNWVEHAARYDETVYTLAARDAADAYRKDLADYRKRYGDAGKALFGASVRLLDRINRTIASAENINPGSISLVTNGLKTAADLEALALRVENLLGKLADNAESSPE